MSTPGEQAPVPVLDGVPGGRAWLVAVAVVVIEVTALAWGLTLLP